MLGFVRVDAYIGQEAVNLELPEFIHFVRREDVP